MARSFLSAALSFNPLVSLVAAIAAAMLWTKARSWTGIAGAWAVLAIGWAVADGVLLVPMLERALAQGGADPYVVAAGGLASFGIGYALPAWSGAFVGVRVTRGTGWASAAVVAATISATMGAVAARFG